MNKDCKINILGTYYILTESNEQTDKRLKGRDGFCDTSTKECVVESMEDADVNNSKKIQPNIKNV